MQEGWEILMEVYASPMENLWAVRALISSSLVGVMCGVLGCFIVLRNMSLIGDALSHAVLPGVVFAFIAMNFLFANFYCTDANLEECLESVEEYYPIGYFIGSTIAGLLTAVIITLIQRNVRTENDAAIGIVFTTMFSIGVIGISAISKSGGVHLDLKDMLFGNTLGVSDNDMIITSLVGIAVISSIIIFFRQLFSSTFQPIVAETMGIKVNFIHYFLMLILSFAVVASLRTVGVILVVAMLVTPSATALLLANRLQRVIVLSGVLGLFASVIGIHLSIIFNTTPGPAIVIVSTLFYGIAILFTQMNKAAVRKNANRSLS